MAYPISLVGTAVGILSLCLQLSSSLNDYVENFKEHNIYVKKVRAHLDRLRDLTRVIESAIPALQAGYCIPSQVAVLCLKDCKAELESFDAQLRKYDLTASNDVKDKLKETNKRIQFCFSRPDLEKLADHLDRVNNLLGVAFRGSICVHILSSNQDKFTDTGKAIHSNTAELAAIHNKVDEIHTRDINIENSLRNNQATVTWVSQDVRLLALAASKMEPLAPQVSQIQSNTYSSLVLLHQLTESHKVQQENTANLEERLNELKDVIFENRQSSPSEKLFQMLMSKPDFLRSWQNEATTHQPNSPRRITNDEQELDPPASLRQPRQLWFVFTKLNESIIKFTHEPGCPKYQNDQTNRQHTVGIVYTGLRQLLNATVVVSLTRTNGAGGYSISPVLRYYATVDSRQSPAFQLTGKECRQFINTQVSRLQRIFIDRASGPTDVDENGRTLMEAALFEFLPGDELRRLVPKLIPDMVRMLQDLGVSCFSNAPQAKNNLGIVSCIMLAIEDVLGVEETKSLLTQLLCQEKPENYLCETTWVILTMKAARASIFDADGIAELFGLDHPLFEALMKRDENILKRILQRRLIPLDYL
ncbi:hypothetical protein F4811DRAFT_553335 [Daldinia bambusicola]|nr:hypothetical protein F4811DRAFT_553335 [Daldinia bambusicola]